MGPEHVPLSCLGEVVLANVKFCVFSKWAPNTSRYPVSGRLIFTIVVFLRYGPRTRPAILSRGGCSCKRQVLCFFEMGPEHVPLSCVGQAILSRAGPFIWESLSFIYQSLSFICRVRWGEVGWAGVGWGGPGWSPITIITIMLHPDPT